MLFKLYTTSAKEISQEGSTFRLQEPVFELTHISSLLFLTSRLTFFLLPLPKRVTEEFWQTLF